MNNIKDNQLSKMLKTQKELQERLNALPKYKGLNCQEDYQQLVKQIKEMSIHVNQEMNEMLYELPWFKPWSRKYEAWSMEQCEAQMEKARQEFIDVFTFLLNIALYLGFDGEMWELMYYMKNKINHKRQDSGY